VVGRRENLVGRALLDDMAEIHHHRGRRCSARPTGRD
jgi:hypothetical protein